MTRTGASGRRQPALLFRHRGNLLAENVQVLPSSRCACCCPQRQLNSRCMMIWEVWVECTGVQDPRVYIRVDHSFRLK